MRAKLKELLLEREREGNKDIKNNNYNRLKTANCMKICEFIIYSRERMQRQKLETTKYTIPLKKITLKTSIVIAGREVWHKEKFVCLFVCFNTGEVQHACMLMETIKWGGES